MPDAPPNWRWQPLFPGARPVLTNTPPGHDFCTGCGKWRRCTAYDARVQRCYWCKYPQAGSRNPHARLLEADVAAMRRQYAEGTLSYRQLARTYGIGVGHAYRIVHYDAWRHLAPEAALARALAGENPATDPPNPLTHD